jgi:hypothetical protein
VQQSFVDLVSARERIRARRCCWSRHAKICPWRRADIR